MHLFIYSVERLDGHEWRFGRNQLLPLLRWRPIFLVMSKFIPFIQHKIRKTEHCFTRQYIFLWPRHLLHGAEYYLKTWLSLSLSKIILLSLWKPKIRYRIHKSPPLDPISSQLNPVRPIDPCFPKVQLNVILPPTPRSSQWSLPFGPPNQNPLNTSPLPHACHMFCPLHPPWFNYPNNIWWRIQVMKFIIMYFSSRSVFLPFRSKYLPQHTVLKNPQSMFLPQSERPSFAPIQHNRQNYSCVYFIL
jgi:hypothetical protein